MKKMIVFSLLSLVLAGCVSTPIEPEEPSPMLIISENSDGATTLIWESDPNYYYTIYYRDGKSKWMELRRATRLRGTGKTMQTTDRVDPNKVMRRYRLFFEKVDG